MVLKKIVKYFCIRLREAEQERILKNPLLFLFLVVMYILFSFTSNNKKSYENFRELFVCSERINNEKSMGGKV
ncbi:hypothetical protein C2H98_04400 [Niallia circulans]|nr:hypothetical protein C2H98_04400 [Niallia circulans]